MTQLLLLTLLVLSNGPAYAEWVAVDKTDDGETTIYVDRGTIHRKGNMVKWWVLTDHKTVQTGVRESFLSVKSQHEYDCAEERHRTLALTIFSGNMGSGKMVYSDSEEQNWEPVQPQSVGQFLWKVACNKK